jgi:hypothetical protein
MTRGGIAVMRTRMPQSEERHLPFAKGARAHRGSGAKVLCYTGRRMHVRIEERNPDVLTKWNKRESNA